MNSIEAPNENCESTRELFSDYLDGTVSGREMQSVAQHLDQCLKCDTEFAGLKTVQQILAEVGPAKAPADLNLRLRLAIAQESARRQAHWWDGISQLWAGLLRPLMLRASAGLACTVVLLGGIALIVSMFGAPIAVMANDEPLGALSAPHFAYSAVNEQPITTTNDATIVIEARINTKGEVYDYTIISAPLDPATEAQVRDHLMVMVYTPAMAFGTPVRGIALITFSGMSVKG